MKYNDTILLIERSLKDLMGKEKFNIKEVLKAVDNPKWQEFRKSLKGLSTNEKIKKLRGWKRKHKTRADKIRVRNYLGALRRGGQLPKGEK